ncbi:egl nine homolog 3 isoform X2 [Electrophorus electricus]|uniref:egl nine homolog 3 isoform X2 n=1 Tax=Electrophorus electricus TaxID=8005 RepID=UPI000F09ED04|nr:egl nine homolog 3 isoform X2 [Electrophorus electricus]
MAEHQESLSEVFFPEDNARNDTQGMVIVSTGGEGTGKVQHRYSVMSGRNSESADPQDGENSGLPCQLRKPRSNRPKSKEHKRLNTHKLVLQYIVPCMNSYGLCIIDNFLGNKVGDRILQEVRCVHEGGKMQDGQLACQKLDKSKAIRGDKIAWVDGTETGCHNIGFLLSRMDKLITFADGKLGSYKIRGRHKEHGGVLRIFPEGKSYVADIEPLFDRLLLFWSDRRNPHEVQPSFSTRYAITVWYFDSEERAEAKRRFRDLTASSQDSTTS